MPVVYGDSFGQLSQNDLGYANLRQHGLESALASATSALQNMRQRQMQSDQFTRSLANENQHWKQQHEDALASLAAGEDLRKAQAEHLRSLTDMPPEKQRSLALQTNLAYSAAQAGEPVDDFDLPESLKGPLRAVSQAADARNTQEYQRAHGLALAWNAKTDLEDKIAAAKTENKNLEKPFIMSPQSRAKRDQNLQNIEQWTDLVSQNTRRLKPFEDSKLLDKYLRPSVEVPGTVEIAVGTPYSLRKRNIPLDTSVMPANTIPNRRTYGMSGRTPNFVPVPARAEPTQMAPGMPDNPPVPQDNAPAPMITSPSTSTSTQGGDKRSWVIGRAKELIGMGLDSTAAVTRARAEYDANP